MDSKVKIIGLLMPLSLFACKSTGSGISATGDDPFYNFWDRNTGSVDPNQKWPDDETMTGDKARPFAKQQLVYAGKSYEEKSKKEVQCLAKISKDASGKTVLIEAGSVMVGQLEENTFYMLEALDSGEITFSDFIDLIKNPVFGRKPKNPDLSYKLTEVNFTPQPSVARPGFTRIAYESAKNDKGQEIKQYVVVKDMTEKTIAQTKGEWEFLGREGGRDCNNLKVLKYTDTESAVFGALSEARSISIPVVAGAIDAIKSELQSFYSDIDKEKVNRGLQHTKYALQAHVERLARTLFAKGAELDKATGKKVRDSRTGSDLQSMARQLMRLVEAVYNTEVMDSYLSTKSLLEKVIGESVKISIES